MDMKQIVSSSEKRRRKKVGKLPSQGVPFHKSLEMADSKMATHTQGKSARLNIGRGHEGFSERRGLHHGVREIETELESLSSLLTLVSSLGIWIGLGAGLLGLLAMGSYLVAWEIVGEVFFSVERRLPKPLRFLWKMV